MMTFIANTIFGIYTLNSIPKSNIYHPCIDVLTSNFIINDLLSTKVKQSDHRAIQRAISVRHPTKIPS